MSDIVSILQYSQFLPWKWSVTSRREEIDTSGIEVLMNRECYRLCQNDSFGSCFLETSL